MATRTEMCGRVGRVQVERRGVKGAPLKTEIVIVHRTLRVFKDEEMAIASCSFFQYETM